MPVSLDVVSQFRVVHVRYAGAFRRQAGVEIFGKMFDHPDFNTRFGVLVDLSLARFPHMQFSETLDLATALRPMCRQRHPKALTALLAPTEVGFGLARMFQTMSDVNLDAPIGVFRSVDQALAHLGLSAQDRAVTDALSLPPYP